MPPTARPLPLRASREARKTPPQIGLGDLRMALGLTLDQVIERLAEETGRTYSRGTISAIENGHRGPSSQLLQALHVAYGLRAGAIRTDREPRSASRVRATGEDVA